MEEEAFADFKCSINQKVIESLEIHQEDDSYFRDIFRDTMISNLQEIKSLIFELDVVTKPIEKLLKKRLEQNRFIPNSSLQ